ncbi:MAG: phosphonoacetaldehyde reductase [Brevinema sp.]
MSEKFIGTKSLTQLPAVLEILSPHNILIFTLRKSFTQFKPMLEEKLGTYSFFYYSDISPNPKATEVEQALEKITQPYDLIIAFGGGSVIDFAKLFKVASDNFCSIKQCFQIKDQLKNKTPLIVIPTTFGTGSEATQFAVVYIDGEKHSLDSKTLLPDYAFVDPMLSLQSPPYLKACSAMDAFAQAIESFWSVHATQESDRLSLNALQLLHRYVIDCVQTPQIAVAEHIAQASHWAGEAINITRTTISHALSYKITSLYGIPHGHAVALTLPKVFFHHLQATPQSLQDPKSFEQFSQKMETLKKSLQITSLEEVIPYFTNLYNAIGLEYRINHLNITDIEAIVDSVNQERLKNSPVIFTKKEMMDLFILS